MPNAVITVAGILPPEQGKKQGKIKDTAGGSWNVWGDKLHNYQIGQTYNIVYEENEFNNSKFYVIKSFNAIGPVLAQPATPQPRAPMPAAMPSAKDEMIFVCGALNNALANPNVQPFQIGTTEMVAFINLARQSWRLTLGKTPKSEDEFRDEIPF